MAKRSGSNGLRRKTAALLGSALPGSAAPSGTWGPPPLGPIEFYNLDYYRETVPNSEQTLPTACMQSNESYRLGLPLARSGPRARHQTDAFPGFLGNQWANFSSLIRCASSSLRGRSNSGRFSSSPEITGFSCQCRPCRLCSQNFWAAVSGGIRFRTGTTSIRSISRSFYAPPRVLA